MLGLGETRDELVDVLRDLRASRRRLPDARPVPATDAAPPAGRALPRAARVRRAARDRAARSASATSRAGRSCAAPSAPTRSSIYSPPAKVRDEEVREARPPAAVRARDRERSEAARAARRRGRRRPRASAIPTTARRRTWSRSWSRPRAIRATTTTRRRAGCRTCAARWAAGTQRRYGLELDPETQIISTIGAKEGLSHFVIAAIARGDTVLCPDPCYPIHSFSVLIAGGDIRRVPLLPLDGLIERLEEATEASWPRPKMLIASFPHNPTTATVDLRVPDAAGRVLPPPRSGVRARSGLRRDLLRRLQAAERAAGAGGARLHDRVHVALEVARDGGLARRLRRRQRGAGARALAREELPRLRHVPADPDRHDRRARRAAGLRGRDRRGLPRAPQRAGRRARAGGLEDREAARDDVRVGAAAGALQVARLARVLEAPAREGGRSRSRRASASVRRGRASCASRWSRTRTASARRCAA